MVKRSALVTGATGFVGSNLTKRLVAEGWKVDLVCRLDSSLRQLAGIEDRITAHRHDGSTEQLISICNTAKPSIVFHLASLFIAEHQPDQVAPLINSNLLFATQLAEAMSRCGIERLVNTGTSWQHFNNEDYNPVNLYATTKQAFEAIIQYYVETAGLKVITLKLFDTYGPNDLRPKLTNLLIKSAHTGGSLNMSPGEQYIDLVHIDDVVNAYLIAAELLNGEKAASHKKYSVTTKKHITLKEFVALFERMSGKRVNIQWGERPYRSREVMKPWEAGELLPGWEPRILLEYGIASIMDGIPNSEL